MEMYSKIWYDDNKRGGLWVRRIRGSICAQSNEGNVCGAASANNRNCGTQPGCEPAGNKKIDRKHRHIKEQIFGKKQSGNRD